MRWLQIIRNWFREPSSGSIASSELSRELQALLDLCCYAASQAVACSKLIEREIDQLNTAGEEIERLIQEHSNLQTNLQHLQEIISTLHTLLNSARADLVLGCSRFDWESSRRMVAELLTGRDVLELKQALRNLDQKSVGSEP
jgi:hypothetical protein